MQGLGELGKHKSRLEKEKEAAAAARKASGGSPAPIKLPSYMRPTSASKAMQKVIPPFISLFVWFCDQSGFPTTITAVAVSLTPLPLHLLKTELPEITPSI